MYFSCVSVTMNPALTTCWLLYYSYIFVAYGYWFDYVLTALLLRCFSWLWVMVWLRVDWSTIHMLNLTVDPDWLCFTVDYGSWFNHVLHWHEATKSLPNGLIHVMTYENLHKVQNYVLDMLSNKKFKFYSFIFFNFFAAWKTQFKYWLNFQ